MMTRIFLSNVYFFLALFEFEGGFIFNKTQNYIYEGTLGEQAIMLALSFNPDHLNPNYRGILYYQSLPDMQYKIKGERLYNCETKDAYPSRSGEVRMIVLKLYQKQHLLAEINLCPQKKELYELEGWLYSPQKNYPIRLRLKSIK